MAMTAQMVICWFEEPATQWLRQRQHDCDLVATEVLTARELSLVPQRTVHWMEDQLELVTASARPQ
jgi:hypothetical protein